MINYIIKENIDILDIFSKIVILQTFYVSFIIFLLYNFPIILTYKLLLTGKRFILKDILYYMFKIFYKGPMFIGLYLYTSKSLNNILVNFRHNNPRHLFSTTIIYITYGILYLSLFLIRSYISIIPTTILYSIYISQLSYNFIDNTHYQFKNPITFYNSNYIFFNTLGLIHTLIEKKYFIPYDFEILGLFFFILLIFPILITYKYRKSYSINWFYVPELTLSYILKP